jgi:hypothetical protein
MKLDVAVNEVVLSNVGTQGEFRIRNSAKAFKILSDGLYSNKIRAVIRELACNAVDSHVGAGKADVPFEVHLPTMLEPWFSVRDFGVGLNRDQVVNIYTTYFESTKTDSNAYIGALGLGSKSPFSYTENFTVTAIKDGIKSIYSAFINEQGVPSIAEMSSEETTEGNGVEVKFSVTNRNDYNSFREESRQVFTWFKLRPNVIGADNFKHLEQQYKEQNIIPGVHLRIETHSYYDRNSSNNSIAVMGNIAYPLGKMPEPQKNLGHLAELLECGLVMEFDIGELDFAASREELSYVPSTLINIKKKLEQLNANLAIHLTKKADAIKCEWERALYLCQEARTKIYKAAVAKYVTDTKFELYDPKAYYGQKTFQFKVEDLEKRGLTMTSFTAYNASTSRINHPTVNYAGSYLPTAQVAVDANVVIVLNDLKTGCTARAKHHYAHHNSGKTCTVHCVSHNDPDLAVRQLEYDKLIKELHNPPIIVKASTLTGAVRKTPTASTGILTIALKANCNSGHSGSYTWRTFDGVIDDNKTYYYVALDKFTSYNPADDKEFDTYSLKAMMDECGVPDIAKIEIFGVRKSRIKEISELDNWVWIEEALKKETAKISDKDVVSLVANECLDTYYERVYTNQTVASAVGPDSYYHTFMKEIAGIKRATGNVTHLATLCGKYGKTVQVEAVKKKIKDAKELLYKKYPFLKLLKNHSHGSDVTTKEITDYIKMVDQQEKI